MTPEERKAWEDVVVDARGRLERRAKQGLPHTWESVRDESILAADAELKRLREELDGYREKADAIHRYLIEKKPDAVMAVVTELSLDAERRKGGG